jgi:hypothetical protein
LTPGTAGAAVSSPPLSRHRRRYPGIEQPRQVAIEFDTGR